MWFSLGHQSLCRTTPRLLARQWFWVEPAPVSRKTKQGTRRPPHEKYWRVPMTNRPDVQRQFLTLSPQAFECPSSFAGSRRGPAAVSATADSRRSSGGRLRILDRVLDEAYTLHEIPGD